MKIIILGADGYYGRALENRLRSAGHIVFGIDNLSRRQIDIELGTSSLTPLPNFLQEIIDVTNFSQLYDFVKRVRPDAIIHLAEQRSAPYSQKSIKSKAYTVSNNTVGTLNVLECAKEFKFHLIHIGSMGVYGYDSETSISDNDSRRAPGSVYHATKCFDSILFEMYSRQFGIRITDLHQGIIWGIGGRFDYDGYFGTVLNRFIVQSMINLPVTLYGAGNQQRSFINIENSLDSVQLVLSSESEGMRSFNQFTEIYTLSKLALFFESSINLDNPRIENEFNTLTASNTGLVQLGLSPIKISNDAIESIKNHLEEFKDNIDRSALPPRTKW
jgi:UDP-sulfoquinovose synthase